MALFTILKSLQIQKHDTLLISLENNKTGLSWKTYCIKALKETHFVCLFSVSQGIYIHKHLLQFTLLNVPWETPSFTTIFYLGTEYQMD